MAHQGAVRSKWTETSRGDGWRDQQWGSRPFELERDATGRRPVAKGRIREAATRRCPQGMGCRARPVARVRVRDQATAQRLRTRPSEASGADRRAAHRAGRSLRTTSRRTLGVARQRSACRAQPRRTRSHPGTRRPATPGQDPRRDAARSPTPGRPLRPRGYASRADRARGRSRPASPLRHTRRVHLQRNDRDHHDRHHHDRRR